MFRKLSKKLRPTVWWITGIYHKHRKILALAFVVGLVICIASIPLMRQWSQSSRFKPVIMGLVDTPTPTDLPSSVEELISLGLTQVSDSGEVRPSLAESWEMSEDERIYTFHLKKNILWHDGTPFTASDVNYNLKDVEFIPANTYELKVKLKEPFTPLPAFLSKPLFKKGLVGVGAYKLITIKLKGEQVSYLNLAPVSPDLPSLEIKFFPSEQLAKTAFKLGEVNMLDELTDASPFSGWVGVDVQEAPMTDRFVAVFFNINNDLFKEKEFRQALSFATEKPVQNRLTSPIARRSWAYTSRVKPYDQDLEQAKKLLGSKVPAEEITLSVFPQYLSLANTIAGNWTALGLNVKVKTIDTLSNDFQAVLASVEIPSDPDQYPLWHSTQTETNITGYNSPKIDKLLEDARKETDQEERKELYAEFQRYLVEDAPAIFLFHPTLYTVIRK